jgi:hypothetical protein
MGNMHDDEQAEVDAMYLEACRFAARVRALKERLGDRVRPHGGKIAGMLTDADYHVNRLASDLFAYTTAGQQ